MQSAMDVLQQAFPSGLADSVSDFLASTSVGKWAKKKMNTDFKTRPLPTCRRLLSGPWRPKARLE